MIYNSTITSVNESDIMSLLESTEDRFECYTIAEATAMIVGEQEENWTRFMKGIGLSELATVMEGQEVVYEGARLQSFISKAKGYFQMALNKLAEITKSFIAKIEQFFKSNDDFLKKYESTLRKNGVPADFEFEGYTFSHLDSIPKYGPVGKGFTTINQNTLEMVIENKEKYSKAGAESAVFGSDKPEGDSLSAKLNNYFYGKEKKHKLTVSVDAEIKVLKETKGLKKEAKDSYTKAAKEIKSIISTLDKAEKEFKKTNNESLEKANRTDSAFNMLLTYWKAYSSAASQMHGAYMGALGARNRQAKAICTKLLTTAGKAKGKEERKEIKAKMESGFVSTDAFLGAVEFI